MNDRPTWLWVLLPWLVVIDVLVALVVADFVVETFGIWKIWR